jgi:diguanylate cyclase (GGDEF)-like protein
MQVIDLGSRNGTFCNGERVQVRILADGDKVQFGNAAILKFSYQDSFDEALQQNLYESITRDALTGLANKKVLLDAVLKEFAYAKRHAAPLSLLMIDIDQFKSVNDRHGHVAGDHVLQCLALKIKEALRVEDMAARYGGEEFAVLLRGTKESEACACAERIRRVVEKADFAFNCVRIPVTVSIGVATFLGAGLEGGEELIALADKYLYKAKALGRNRVQPNMGVSET